MSEEHRTENQAGMLKPTEIEIKTASEDFRIKMSEQRTENPCAHHCGLVDGYCCDCQTQVEPSIVPEQRTKEPIVGAICNPPCVFYAAKSCMCAHLEASGYAKHFKHPSSNPHTDKGDPSTVSSLIQRLSDFDERWDSGFKLAQEAKAALEANAALIASLREENVRLTRERDEAVADLDAHAPGIEEWEAVQAERDRLRAALDECLKHCNDDEGYEAIKAERDRLTRELKIKDDANDILTRERNELDVKCGMRELAWTQERDRLRALVAEQQRILFMPIW
jgi:hypothetical protein